VGAARDIMHDYQHVISELTLMTGSAGVFDVVIDGETIYSKHVTGRHAEPGEVLALLRDFLGPEVPIYER
jgi:predicted Rdx family selenoprotein